MVIRQVYGVDSGQAPNIGSKLEDLHSSLGSLAVEYSLIDRPGISSQAGTPHA